ncbi:MAG: MiaB/RimO family radical SAM methylthiotransferase [Gemmatimonadaceae bacterium]
MKVLLRTFGCRANRYDTEALRALLIASGAEEALHAEDADAAVFNSCSVTAAAEADLRAAVRRVSRRNPGIRSIVMGCASGAPGRDEVTAPLRSLPSVTDVVAGADMASVAAALGLRSAGNQPATLQTGSRALLRIQDGCDEHCTFCATTLARGANRSRLADELVREASALADSHPEIVVTGIHIGSYGSDCGSSLGKLMERLIGDVPSVRFRLTSIEATEVDDRLRKLFDGDATRLAPCLHAPLQSGSDSVLKRMGRHWYAATEYADAVQRIVGAKDVFALSADVIAGFPGETESDHAATMEMVARLPFTSLHVFPYSSRPGTAASRLGGQVSASVAARRAGELRAAAADKSVAYACRRSGGHADVVVIGRGEGLTEDYLSVAVADSTLPRRARFNATLDHVENRLVATQVSTFQP